MNRSLCCKLNIFIASLVSIESIEACLSDIWMKQPLISFYLSLNKIYRLKTRWLIRKKRNTYIQTRQLKLVINYISPTFFCKLIIHQCRWSKIAKHLPGRTDNEIKNYWRTRIQKHIKQAENSQSQEQGSDIQINDDNNNNQLIGSTSQISNIAEPMDTNIISPPSYQGILEPFPPHHQFPTISDQSGCSNYWSMEDLLSLQLLNGD